MLTVSSDNTSIIAGNYATYDGMRVGILEKNALLDKINYAIDQLNAVEGDWQNDLSNLYYDYQDVRELL